MRATGITIVLLCFVAIKATSAAPPQLTPGLWEITTLLRNFSLSADRQREIEMGGSGPNIDQVCSTKPDFTAESLYPRLKKPAVASHCKATTISETSTVIDSVVECSARNDIPYIAHTVVTAPTPKEFVTIADTTFLETNSDGSISRSAVYRRGRWLKGSCGE